VNRTIFILIILLILLFGSVFWYYLNSSNEPREVVYMFEANDILDTIIVSLSPEMQEYFTREMRQGVLDRVGKPIQGYGYTPFMFLAAFPELRKYDFDGADANLGIYAYHLGTLEFILDENAEPQLNKDVLTDEGMKTFFARVVRRLGVAIPTTTDEVDVMLDLLI
jgi:hypothetical protein